MSNSMLKFLKKRIPSRKKKKVNRRQTKRAIAKSNTSIGRIAKKSAERDRMLEEIMRGM